jgi:fructokinase
VNARAWIFGEVLFDHFPGGRRVLGGAPFNVAWHLQAFGTAPWFISRVGDDDDGAAVHTAMREWGMDTGGLQLDADLPTGKVRVSFEHGEPTYDIVCPAAWDAIEAPTQPPRCALLYHGSLALRRPESRAACRALRQLQPPLVFVDVNLRPPWYERRAVLEALEGASWVKLNRQELAQLVPADAPGEEAAENLLQQLGLQGLIVTDGARGAEVLTADGVLCRARPGQVTAIADTVGAGDALAAIMVLGLSRGWPLQTSLDRAQLFASAIVGQTGATVSDPAFYAAFARDFGEDC